jgi:hypothetical protein
VSPTKRSTTSTSGGTRKPKPISATKHLAAVLLAQGAPLRQICEDAAIGRTTLWDWRTNDEEFAAIYAEVAPKLQKAIIEQATHRLRMLADKAVAGLDRALDETEAAALNARAADIVTKRIAEMAPQTKVDLTVSETLAERLAALDADGDTSSD